MDSLFASLEASGALEAARPEPATPHPDAPDDFFSVETGVETRSTLLLAGEAAAQNGAHAEDDDPTLAEIIAADPALAAQLAQMTSTAPTRLGRKRKSSNDSAPVDAATSAASPTGALTISALSGHLIAILERDDLLRDVWVVGEVSNWKRAGSGHAYFSMKDAGATISAVMWRSAVLTHGWLPRDGDQVLAHGHVSLYPERGTYQIYVNQVRPVGRGQLYAAFEALKEKLALEGLFAAERKRPLPPRIARVGVVTSRDGAALRDILRIITLRWPLLEVLIFPAQMQGADCPAQVCAALANANRYNATVERLDLIILARGGGSIEDLWGFNDEQVARAVASSALPVITGVGHETDFTIADFVADLRAPTPSAAAMATCPDRADLLAQLASARRQLAANAATLLEHEQRHLEQRSLRLQRIHPERALAHEQQRLAAQARRLHAQMQRRLERLTDRQRSAANHLDALSPLAVLQRGYSIVQRASGAVVMGPAMSEPGEELTVRAAHGAYSVTRRAEDAGSVADSSGR